MANFYEDESSIDSEEVLPNDILHREHRTFDAVVDPKLPTLPLGDLAWPEFEELSLRVFSSSLSDFGSPRAFRQGRSGQKQHGFDLIAKNSKTEKFVVAECKKVKAATTADIERWIDKFLVGKYSKCTEKYILITSLDFGSDTSLIERWHRLTTKLADKNIDSELWDYKQLLDKLRYSPSTVEEIFGQQVMDRFCLKTSDITKYPSLFPPKEIFKNDRYIAISNGRIRLDLFLPSDNDHTMSCSFNFARSDLNGFSIAVPSEFLIALMQSRAHCRHITDCQYLYDALDSHKYVFALPSARLTLNKDDLNDLDWIIVNAWNIYLAETKQLEQSWKTIRFKRIRRSSMVFSLFSIDRAFWREILLYTNTFDYANGSSDDHIYERGNFVKVYTPDNRANLDPGYHVKLFTYSEADCHNSDLIIGWTPQQRWDSCGTAISSRQAWDAEYTYYWLETALFPKVYEWSKRRHKIPIYHSFLNRSIKDLFRKNDRLNFPSMGNLVFSRTDLMSRGIGERATNLEELRNLVIVLQSHFHAYMSKSSLEPQLKTASINACKLLLERRPKFNSHYVKSKLGLNTTEIYSEIGPLNNDAIENLSADLDLALRALYSIVHDIEEVTTIELQNISQLLKPIWDRYYEDLICMSYY